MGAWTLASEKHPLVSDESPAPVWICLGSGVIVSAIFKRMAEEEAGRFYSLDGIPMEGVTQWMPRRLDRIPPHPG